MSAADEFASELIAGLRATPRAVAPKWFYDQAGSELFDQICELPEYYPTRTELAILQRHAGDIAALAGPRAEIVEFGAGSCTKVRLLLDALQAPARYLPIDISGEHLQAAAAGLRRDYPGLDVQPVAADYTQRLLLPARDPGAGQRVGFFPGSTLGNFLPAEASYFLQVAAQVLRGGALLLGVDLVKDPAVLHAAYNDAQGVTAAVNLPQNQVRWAMSYMAEVQLWKLALIAQLDASIPLSNGVSAAASAGGGVRLHLDPFGLLLGVRGGLGSAGVDVYGRYYGFLGFEWAP